MKKAPRVDCVILCVLILSALAVGCGSSPTRQPQGNRAEPFVERVGALRGERVPTVLFGHYSVPYYFLLGEYVGDNPDRLSALLSEANIKRVVFLYNHNKAEDISRSIRSKGIQVDELTDLPSSALDSAIRGTAVERSNSVVVLFGNWRSPDHVFVGNFIGASISKAIAALEAYGVRRVIFESGLKMMPETANSFISDFERARVDLDAFQVPRGTGTTGWLDYLSRRGVTSP